MIWGKERFDLGLSVNLRWLMQWNIWIKACTVNELRSCTETGPIHHFIGSKSSYLVLRDFR